MILSQCSYRNIHIAELYMLAGFAVFGTIVEKILVYVHGID